MILLSALIMVATFSSGLHPLHVAYTNIDINNNKQSVSVTHKVFKDDFTVLFAHLFEKTIEAKEDSDFTAPEIDLIKHYMNYRFILISGSDTIDLEYRNKKLDNESLYLYFDGKCPEREFTELTINNLLLLDLYMDQTNLVIVNHGDREEGLTFNWENREATVRLEEK